MIEYIAAYKNHEECPVLVEEGYEDRVDSFVRDFQSKSLIRDTFDLTAHGACAGNLIVMKNAVSGEICEVYDFEISCPVDLNDKSSMEKHRDSDGYIHTVQKVTCPECGTTLEIDLWEDKQDNSHQITRLYNKDGDLILEVIE